MGSSSRLVGIVCIETAATPGGRGLADDERSLGEMLRGLTCAPLRSADGRLRPVDRFTVLAHGGLESPPVSANLQQLAADLQRTLDRARQLAAALDLAS